MGVGKVLLPPDIVETSGPVVFLAGPVNGAPQWQPQAVTLLLGLEPSLSVVNPRGADGDLTDAQIDWEAHYLQVADVILFWLPKEIGHNCERPYAQTSRFALGEWMARGGPLVVGIEKGFSGEHYIRRRLQATRPDVEVLSTLTDTCQAVLHQIGT